MVGLIEKVKITLNWRHMNKSYSKRLLRYLSNDDRRSAPAFTGDPVVVNEGDKSFLTWKNLYVFPEHSRFNLKNTDIIFTIIDQPSHGTLQFENGDKIKNFNYENLLENKIFYKHDGSQISQDSFDLQVDIKNKNDDINRDIDFDQNVLTIYVNIININDPPVLELANDKYSFLIPEESRRLLSTDQLVVFDVDDSNNNVYIILLEAQGVQLQNNLSGIITNFTLNQLINHQIYIADDGSNVDYRYIKLQANDLVSKSNVLTINCIVKKISIEAKYNTGIVVSHGLYHIISWKNLTFKANIDNVCEIEYKIIDEPSYGEIECNKENEKFSKCLFFNQKDIDEEKIRYKHTIDNRPINDSFSFITYCNNISSSQQHFYIKFAPLEIRIFNSKPLILNNTEQSILERSNLAISTKPQGFKANELIYYIVEPPKFGILSRKITEKKNRRIGVSSNFTQQHINDGLINYKLHFVQYSVINDYFIFKVVTPSKVSELTRFDITYIPSGNSIKLINRTISVERTNKQQIPKTSLWLETSDDNDFIFYVAIPPSFGSLMLVDDSGEFVSLKINDTFGSEDILQGKLYYKHDGFNNSIDDAYIVAMSIYKGNSRFPFLLTFHIIKNINLITSSNVDPFKIDLLLNSERVVYPWMLMNSNNNNDNIFYKIISKMENFVLLYFSNRKQIISSFTFKDLMKKKLIVKHVGSKINEIVKIQISDGFNNITTNIIFRTDSPYVKLTKNIIRYNERMNNKYFLISSNNLSCSCNLDVDRDEINFNMLGTNGFYKLFDGKFIEIFEFSQYDIEMNKIFFKKLSFPSKIIIEVSCKDLKKIENIYFEKNDKNVINFVVNPLLPINVSFSSMEKITNKTISVDLVNKEEKIIYEIVKFPKQGIVVLNIGDTSKISSLIQDKKSYQSLSMLSNVEVKKFTQENLNLKNIFYVHNGVNEDVIDDNFFVMIHKELVTYGPFKLDILINHNSIEKVSTQLFIELNVKKSMQEILQSYYHYTENNDIVFKVIKQPKIGKLVKEKNFVTQDGILNEFFDIELRNNEIFYSTEKIEKLIGKDTFIIRICSLENGKCEIDLEITFIINSSNIKTPEILKNERLIVWSNNEPSTITSENLYIADTDTPPEKIVYSITKVINGFVSMKADSFKPIKYFTQNDINQNLIKFTLTQDSTGGFSFSISDGKNRIGPEWFSIEKAIKNSIVFENNARLFTYPSGSAVIGTNLLKVVYLDSLDRDIIYHISKQPKHGKILLNGNLTNTFSQNDLANSKLIFKSTNINQKHWLVKDYFLFNVSTNSKVFSHSEKFRIAITYSLVQQDKQNLFVNTSKLFVSTGGSAIISQFVLNMTQLLKYLSKEKLILNIWKPPKFGNVHFFKGQQETNEIKGDDLLISNKYIYYKNDQKNENVDDVWFSICPQDECDRRGSKMKIHLPIKIITPKNKDIKIMKFEETIFVDETGIRILNDQSIKVTHPFLSSSNIYFTVHERIKNFTGLFVGGKLSKKFSQKDIENNIVEVKKFPNSAINYDLLQIDIGGNNRVLKIIYKSMEINFVNHSNIVYHQGKTYVLLNQTHLNVKNMQDRENIIYNITKQPQNGTFYRIDGDKEALIFSQKNIDEGEILYAQVNMDSFHDYFEFSIYSHGNEILKSSSEIVVIPTILYEPFIIEGGTMANIDIKFINASTLLGLSPKFFVITNPKFGKLILNGFTPLNESIKFFSFNDILEHRLFYDAFDTSKQINDTIEIELRGDSIQPARFNYTIQITPTLIGIYDNDSNKEKKNKDSLDPKISIPKIQVDTGSSNFSVLIAAAIIIIILCILFCRKSSSKKDEIPSQEQQFNIDQNPNLYRSLEALQLNKQLGGNNNIQKMSSANILENTVYANIVDQKSTVSPIVGKKVSTNFGPLGNKKKPKILQTFEMPKNINVSVDEMPSCRTNSFPSKVVTQIHKTNSEISSHSKKPSGNTTLKKDQYWV
uniref:Cadherin domain-containing protein n=1 Tax=Parastrongyloides trichosuri TaxID=131310 RepID=A0A0N4ZU91_PARTI